MVVVFISSIGCSSDERIERHLQTLHEINSNISTGQWKVLDGFVDEQEEHFELEKQRADTDTSYCLSFSYFPLSEKYVIDGFSQSFKKKDNYYHEMSIHNNDTIYHFFCTEAVSKERMIPINERHFITGKYYYLYHDGWLSEQQMRYFELHEDSLTKVRGNSIIELPGIN